LILAQCVGRAVTKEAMMGLILFSAPLLLAITIVYAVRAVMKGERERFEQKFPPISDAEFLALCRPGTDPEIALKVRRIVAKQLGVPYERIYPSSRFVEDLCAD
jgi:hypothetical protein